MSTYNGGNMDSAPEYSYGYGPGGPSNQRPGRALSSRAHHHAQPRREKDPVLYGESASYDNLPHSETQTAYDRQATQHAGYSKDRGFTDYFYKKPDPTYTGTYGTDYQPELSKTKVFTATAAVVALFYGVSKYRSKQKEKEKRKKYVKYTNQHAHRGPDEYTGYGNQHPYDDSHSRY
ncbi:hypothetical protein IWW57_006025 [Coemansia sp. S610]|nr:hypothetical protein LPJ60_001936 [Coemansia sp. RSA 2675]KAJ2013671.1 hypothetical protein IWW57_006025 [Coemansia sp. S610]KAJ2413470.1 hypothetical protein GGI10_003041 [Coemansia sp. RSA 2530]KAJ2702030.1 hypothetical protein H4218_001117 [Coemansia sp. IMI 209128]